MTTIKIKMILTVVPTILLAILPMMTSGQSCPAECTSCENGIANCLGTGIRDIPRNFPVTVTIMDLSSNQLTELSSSSFQELPSLQTLRMSGNGISEVMERSFISLPALMSIDLSNNPIVWIHDSALLGLAYLRMLSIQKTKLTNIGTCLKDVPSLHTINMASNKIKSIEDDNFDSNTQLQMIDLSQNQISKISPKAFLNLKRLRYLNLNSNPIVRLSELQFGSNILQLVDFTNCLLEEVPGKMPSSVVDFRLGNNRLTHIKAESFENITNLRLVTLNNNDIKVVEEKAFWELERLIEIWLSNNKLKSIPRLLPRNLNKLFLDHNEVYEIGRRNFPINSQLELLSLDSNNVERISEGAWDGMAVLKSVNLNANQLKVVTSGAFNNMPSLECLRLSNNPIEIFENDAIKDLEKLNDISLSHINSLSTKLPRNFLSSFSTIKSINMMNSPGLVKSFLELAEQRNSPIMDKVMTLSLQYNELENLPANLRRILPNIEKLFLDGNPWYCDTGLTWFKDWMKSSDILFFSHDPLICTAPKDVEGREIISMDNSQFTKPREITPVEQKNQVVAENTVKDVVAENTVKDVVAENTVKDVVTTTKQTKTENVNTNKNILKPKKKKKNRKNKKNKNRKNKNKKKQKKEEQEK